MGFRCSSKSTRGKVLADQICKALLSAFHPPPNIRPRSFQTQPCLHKSKVCTIHTTIYLLLLKTNRKGVVVCWPLSSCSDKLPTEHDNDHESKNALPPNISREPSLIHRPFVICQKMHIKNDKVTRSALARRKSARPSNRSLLCSYFASVGQY